MYEFDLPYDHKTMHLSLDEKNFAGIMQGHQNEFKPSESQQKLVEVDHAFQRQAPLGASVPPRGKKTCRNRKTACGLYKSNTFIDLVSHFLHFLQKGT